VPLDLAGSRQTISINLPVVFPEGTSPREGEPATVTVTVEIVAIDQLFQAQLPAQIQLSGLSPGLLFTLNPTLLNVTVAGSSNALAELAQNPLRALVDVTGLGEGFYSLQPQLQLPTGVSLVGTLPAVDLLLRTPPTPSPSPSPEGEEQPTPEATTTAETTPTPEPTDTLQPTATP
jgi:YbbR domain-containing protein